jgi:hypothetical protein
MVSQESGLPVPDPLACCQVMCQAQGPEQSGQQNVVGMAFKCQMLWPWNLIDREIFRYVFFCMDPFNVCQTSVWYRGQQSIGGLAFAPDPLALEHQGQHNIQVDCSFMWFLLLFAIHLSGVVLRGKQRGL